tara:strand:+ start:55 stop:558 length:504 start_codon:yes stop_codon:yes gene_type:complete
MPKILDRLTQQLKDMGVEKPRATAVSQLQKAGILKKGTMQLTVKGKKRQAMGAAERAKDRAAKYSKGKHKPSDYEYNPRTNQATLKKRTTKGFLPGRARSKRIRKQFTIKKKFNNKMCELHGVHKTKPQAEKMCKEVRDWNWNCRTAKAETKAVKNINWLTYTCGRK